MEQVLLEFPPVPKRASPSRVIVLETVIFQPSDSALQPTETKFDRRLSSDEQPYSRRMDVGREWVSLDCGWVKDAAVLHVKNLEAVNPQRNPSPDERKDVDARVVEIGLGFDGLQLSFARVRSGESCRFEPFKPERIIVRCPSGQAKILVTLIPS